MAGKSSAYDHLKLWHKGLVIVMLPVIFEAAFLWSLAGLLNQAENDIKRQYHVQLLLAQVGTLSKLSYDVATELAPIVTDKARFNEERFNNTLDQIKVEGQSLRQMPSYNRIEKESLRKIVILVDEELQLAVHARLKMGDEKDGLLMIGDQELREVGTELSNQLMTELKQLSQYESTVKRSSTDVRQYVWNWLLAGFFLSVVTAALLIIYFSRQVVQRVGIIAENSRRMSSSQSLAAPLSGTDEIADVDRAFHDMADKLRAANQAKQQFVEMITHDLRSPLNAIKSILDLLSMGALGEISPKAQTRVEQSMNSCDRLLGLVNNLLDIDKLEAGSMEMDFAQIKIASVLRRSVEAVDRLAESYDVKLEAEETQAEAHADEARLIQVLVNLISNAIKYSPKDGVVRVSVVSESAPQNYLEFRVQDSGRGVPEHLQRTIFERFAQVKTTDATEKGGTGLGLAICKAIVEEHKGTIGVQSVEGVGSTFWFRIPVSAQNN